MSAETHTAPALGQYEPEFPRLPIDHAPRHPRKARLWPRLSRAPQVPQSARTRHISAGIWRLRSVTPQGGRGLGMGPDPAGAQARSFSRRRSFTTFAFALPPVS